MAITQVSTNVVIVGAGPAGLGCAALLKQMGINDNDMFVIDAKTIGSSFKNWPKSPSAGSFPLPYCLFACLPAWLLGCLPPCLLAWLAACLPAACVWLALLAAWLGGFPSPDWKSP